MKSCFARIIAGRIAPVATVVTVMASAAHAQNGNGASSLEQLRFDIVGIRFVVDPPALTVPKNIATQINTSLVVPPSAGADVKEALAALSAGALIEAELRGPSIPPTRISVPAGSPIPLPAFALPGDYFLDNIRLAKNGQTVLDATALDGRPATSIPIKVISEVFVTSVTTRPLTLDEIREKGILIDSSSYQAVNFQAAFNIDGQTFTIDMAAVLPTPQLLQLTSDRTTLIRDITIINQTLATTQTTLPPAFDRPGINFSIAALPFFFVPDEDGGIPELDIPPITGLVVIAGNVAFLNQFFKVAVLVSNVTPAGSALVLRDVTGTVALPTGLDRIAGTPEQPGDDPLRLARLDGGIVQGTVPIVQTGPDGVLGTADDIASIPPQKQGEGEILLEGLKEGGHTFDVNIEAFLDGLPSGPVRLVGLAAGAVFVRNPTFSVTLAHPRTIRSGETYDIFATVTNTSRSVANLVSVNLDPLSISGAQLLSDPTITFESIGAGQSATAKYTLRAQQTGEVTFSSFTGEVANGGGIRLFTGIGERNVPLSPNAIVLPRTTEALPASLVAAAQRVLGQAFSIATSPAEALPPDVLFVKRQTVIDRGLELAQAGERVQFGEPLERVIRDLLLDWLGNTTFDEGFDQLLRSTEAGAAFLGEIADLTGSDVATAGGLTYQQTLAQQGAARPHPHVSAIATATGGMTAPVLSVSRSDGTTVRAGEPGATTLPGAGLFAPADESVAARLAVLARVEPLLHIVELVAPAAGSYDLGIVIPGPQAGVVQQLRFSGIALGTGGVARVEIDLSAPGSPTLRIDAGGDGTFESTLTPQVILVSEAPPQLLAARQLESSFREAAGNPRDPATYGLIVGVLFDKPVAAASAEAKPYYTIANNAVIGAQLQQSARVVYLYLQKPIGGLTARTLRVANITDLRGLSVGSSDVPIQMALTDGGRVFGQVREAGGGGVPDAVLRLTVVEGPDQSFDVSTIRVDENGSFDFDFVPRRGQYFTLTAQHPITRDRTSVAARIRGAGEQLLLNPTFLGHGTVRGRLLAADGVTVVPNVPIALIPGAVLGLTGYQTRTNALGEFVFTDVPVGIFTLTASDGHRGFAQVPGLLETASQIIVQDVVLVTQPDAGGHLVGRVFLSDGITPATGFSVYVGQYTRKSGTIQAFDIAHTDDSGSFSFERTLPAGQYDVVAVDLATGQIGVVRAAIAANLTTSVGIVLEATGSVEGVVFNAQGQPVPGAVIAGGVALGTADANGFFRIEGVPAGSRTIQAGDPVTKRRGSVVVTVVPGQTVRVAITLEARATITGRVLDADGHPMARVSVRIPQSGGFTFVFTNSQGVYTFPDMPLGTYLIQAPGPSVDSLISFMEYHGYDPASAFTSGDAGGAGLPPPPSSSDANAVLAAYEDAVRRFFSVDESLLGLPMESTGGFGWNKVELFQDSTTVIADVRFLSQGQVAGRTEDSFGNPTGAVVRVTGLSVGKTGAPILAELGRMNSDAATGQFAFGSIPRFDLATFQTAGVRGGDFTLEAAQPFSPAILAFRGQLNTSTPNLTDIVLRFPSAADTNGTVSGQVFMPDGATPAPANTQVHISFGDLTVLTDGNGRFTSLLPIPASTYIVTATAPNGLRGQSTVIVPAGGNADVHVRLLGLGSATIVVRRPNGVPVANALVRLERGSFPHDRADGQTDADGIIHFTNLTEGIVSVTAEELLTGLRGRASGTILRGTVVTVPLTISGSGRVTGRFLTADGNQSIPFAQVVLTSGSVQAFGTTDSSGAFELLAIPLGRFSVEASDQLTGRLGRATGELLFEGQTVSVTILQLPRGTVSGIVLNADDATPVAAARVALRSLSAIRTELQATARADGGFRFDGIPEGAFEIVATDPVSGFQGRATGRITVEGEFVDVVVRLDPFGALDVRVEDVAGQPAGNASVSISRDASFSRTAAVDATGRAVFDHLPLGTYRVIARSLANAGDGGEAQAVIESANQLVEKTIRFRGTGSVTARVVASDGTTPVVSAQVTLNTKAAFGTAPPGALAATFNGFTDATGAVTFANVPIGDFFARGESGPLGGVATGSLPAPGETVQVTVQLGASATISGRVLLPDAVTPAAQAIVTLRFQPQSQLQSGVLQVTTALGGTFEFRGIPLGSFMLSAFEVVSSGVRNVTGSLASDGQHLALGDLVLNSAGPRVLSVTPADGAAGIAPDALISITFSEPIDPATLSTTGQTANFVLLEGTTAVPLESPVLSEGNRTVTTRTVQPLQSARSYTISLKGAPEGPKDDGGFYLTDPLVSTFTVRDVVPPAVVSVSPINDARGVLPEATVRVTFSEAVADATLVVRDATGTVVPGFTSLTAGHAAVAFSPQNFLHPNTVYTVTVTGVADLANNALVPPTFSSRFFTVDTLAPVIASLQVSGTPRGGSLISVEALVADSDTARVEFRMSDGTSYVSTARPFVASFTLPSSGSTATISAVAVDGVGNRSSIFDQIIAFEVNTPPTVSLTNLAGTTEVAQGQNLGFQVRALDDSAVAQVLFSAVGAASASSVHTVSGTQTDVTVPFSLIIPANAPSGGTITVQAAAIDSGGLQSAPVSLVLSVVDGIRPAITVIGPVNNAVVVPGQLVNVVADITDDVALASVTLTCAPVAAGCESRTLSGTSTRQTFTVTVPQLQAPQTLTLTLIATDGAGNTGTAARVLQIADTVNPTLSALDPVSGSTQVLAGSTVNIRATVADNVGVTALLFSTEGALVTTGSSAVSPPVTSGSAVFSLTVPANSPDGSTIIVRVRARDAAGNLSDERSIVLSIGDATPPTVEFIEPADATEVSPGTSATVRAGATDDTAVARITLSASGVVTATLHHDVVPASTPAAATFSLNVPAGTPAGQITLTLTATDAAGAMSTAVQRTLIVRDVVAPQVRITAPAPGAVVDPRSPVQVTIEATDAVGVTSIAFAASGAVSATESRTIAPAVISKTEIFTITITPLPATGGTVVLTASARDAAGNNGLAQAVQIELTDVVPPDVLSTQPQDGATAVDPASAVTVRFTEPMDPASITSTTVQLRRGSDVIASALALAPTRDVVTLTPAAPLPLNTVISIVVTTGAQDANGNALTAARTFSFTTASPDTDSPRVSGIDPPDTATGVSLVKPVSVTFSEPVDPTTVTPASFRVLIGGSPIAGTISLASNSVQVRFVPADPYPADALVTIELTNAIADPFGNPLAAADGTPLTAPLTFTFRTAQFGITSPAGAEVIEHSQVLLEARATGGAGIASVVFTINGQALAAVSGPVFTSTISVGAASATPTLTVVASGRDAGGIEIARDERTYSVVVGIRIAPRLTGVPLGSSTRLRLTISSALTDDLPITLEAGDPALVGFPVNPVVLPAGQTGVDAVVEGLAMGATAVIARSTRGDAAATVAVSPLEPGMTMMSVPVTAGTAVTNPPLAGYAAASAGSTVSVLVPLLDAPAGVETLVMVLSTNTAVATARAAAIAAGDTATLIEITAHADGIVTLVLRAGDAVKSIQVFVGAPPPGSAPLLLARPTGASIANAAAAGQVLLATGGQSIITVSVLSAPASAETPVSVSSLEPSIATGTSAPIPAGETTATISIQGLANGVTTLIVRAGADVRSVQVTIGPPAPGTEPLILARPAGLSIVGAGGAGFAVTAAGGQTLVALPLLSDPASSTTAVTVTSLNPEIATAPNASIPAGGTAATLTIAGHSDGLAALVVEAAGKVRTLAVYVGTAAANAPAALAPAAGVSVAAAPTLGRVFGSPGVVTSSTLGIRLLSAAATAPIQVTVTSSNPSVALVDGATTTTVTIPAGAQVADVLIGLTGSEGAALLRFQFNGETRELLVIVGDPPPGQIPAVVAPVLGIERRVDG